VEDCLVQLWPAIALTPAYQTQAGLPRIDLNLGNSHACHMLQAITLLLPFFLVCKMNPLCCLYEGILTVVMPRRVSFDLVSIDKKRKVEIIGKDETCEKMNVVNSERKPFMIVKYIRHRIVGVKKVLKVQRARKETELMKMLTENKKSKTTEEKKVIVSTDWTSLLKHKIYDCYEVRVRVRYCTAVDKAATAFRYELSGLHILHQEDTAARGLMGGGEGGGAMLSSWDRRHNTIRVL
jgi:hypothetical protein